MKTYLAKTIQKSTPGHTVFMHCKLSGQVAGRLLDLQPRWLLDRILGSGWDKGKLCFGVSTHDVGKITLVFQVKIHSPCRNSGDKRVDLDMLAYAKEEGICHEGPGGSLVVDDPGHDLASMLSIGPFDESWARIVGSHHGRLRGAKGLAEGDWSFDGTKVVTGPLPAGHREFHKDRHKLLRMLAYSFGLAGQVDLANNKLPFMCFADNDSKDVERYLRGLVAVSDWIASGDYLNKDPLQKKSVMVWDKQVRNAATEAGFNKVTYRLTSSGKVPSFEEVFGFKMHDSQHKLISAVLAMGGPGVVILEEVMGRGKTEAALYAALTALLDSKMPATGISFLLPTKATSDSIYKKRVVKFMKKIVKGRQSWAKLAHQDAWLYDMGAEASLHNSWFAGSKKQLLHAFSVGTVDQALMAVINVKHAAVRTFALAGRVVIFDEVHALDAYMQALLVELTRHLVSLGCRVIMLSATLTSEARSRLLGAESSDNRYPLVSWRSDAPKATVVHSAPHPPTSRKVAVRLVQSGLLDGRRNVMAEAVRRASEEGARVLWVENTVAECQGSADEIESMAATLGVEVNVVHAKYIKEHRALKEADLEKGYGKESVRGAGCLTVTTQVAEQSLDIDADYLVTALCPVDMLFQRIGRLYRHERGVRKWGPHGECVVLLPAGLPLDVEVIRSPMEFGNSMFVYPPYVLARTLEALRSFLERHNGMVSLPEDIRSLVEGVYARRYHEPTPLLEGLKMSHEERVALLKAKAWQSGALDTDAQEDEPATTRYIEDSPRQIMLLQGIKWDEALGSCELTTLLGDCVKLSRNMPKRARVEAARALNKCLVHDSMRKAPEVPTARGQGSVVMQRLTEIVSMCEHMAVVKIDRSTGMLRYFRALNGIDIPVWLKGDRKIPLRYRYTVSRGLRGVL